MKTTFCLISFCALLVVVQAVPLTGYAEFPAPVSSCETNFALVDHDEWDHAKAMCSDHTTQASCEKHHICWWRSADTQQQYYNFRNVLMTQIPTTSVTVATSATTSVSIPYTLLVSRTEPFLRVYLLYTAAGSISAYPVVIETATKAMLINTGESSQGAAVAKLGIAALTRNANFTSGKPLYAVFVPHAHYDEDGGAAYLCQGSMLCYGSKYFNQMYDQFYSVFWGVQKVNHYRIMGSGLPFDSDWKWTATNPTLPSAAYAKINMPVEDGTTLVIDGVTIQLLLTPSETKDQMSVFLPDVGILHVGDLLLPSQVNTFTWRGEQNRNVNDWLASLNKVLPLNFTYVIGSALPALDRTYAASHERVQKAIEFLTDLRSYVTKALNNSVHPSIIENSYQLPASLANDAGMRQRPFYHPLYQQVRGVIETYAGSVAPTYAEFARIPIYEEYQLMIDGLGGESEAQNFVDNVLFESSSPSRSKLLYAIKIAEALKYIINSNEGNSTEGYVNACMTLYTACRQMGYNTAASSERNFYLTCAYENRPELFPVVADEDCHHGHHNHGHHGHHHHQHDDDGVMFLSKGLDLEVVENLVVNIEVFGAPVVVNNNYRSI